MKITFSQKQTFKRQRKKSLFCMSEHDVAEQLLTTFCKELKPEDKENRSWEFDKQITSDVEVILLPNVWVNSLTWNYSLFSVRNKILCKHIPVTTSVVFGCSLADWCQILVLIHLSCRCKQVNLLIHSKIKLKLRLMKRIFESIPFVLENKL